MGRTAPCPKMQIQSIQIVREECPRKQVCLINTEFRHEEVYRKYSCPQEDLPFLLIGICPGLVDEKVVKGAYQTASDLIEIS